LKIILFFKNGKEKNLAQFLKELYYFLLKNLSLSFRIRNKPTRIPDPGPGVKKAPDPDPQHCYCLYFNNVNLYTSISTSMRSPATLLFTTVVTPLLTQAATFKN
jgi:hypothetical protein